MPGDNETDAPTRGEQFLKYAGAAGIVIAVGLALLVVALTLLPAVPAPSAQLLAPAVFTLLLLAVASVLSRRGKRRPGA
jgi:formate/nitrite transporter FocA (FNT family)